MQIIFRNLVESMNELQGKDTLMGFPFFLFFDGIFFMVEKVMGRQKIMCNGTFVIFEED